MRLPIKWKLVFALLLAILIPTTLTTLVSLKVTSSQLEKQLEADCLFSLRYAQNELSGQISSADAILKFIVDSVPIEDGKIRWKSLLGHLEHFKQFSPFSIIEVFDHKGKLMVRSSSGRAADQQYFTSEDSSVIATSLELNTSKDYFLNDRGISIKVAAPVVSMESLATLGVVVVTIPINSVVVQRLKSRTKAEISVEWGDSGKMVSTFQHDDGRMMETSWKTTATPGLPSNGIATFQKKAIGERFYLITSESLMDNRGKTVGVLSAAITVEKLMRNKETLSLIIFASSVVFLIIAVLAGFMIARSFTTPITRLVATMHDIASGDLDKRVNISGNDEIADMAQNFNDMSDKLLQSFRKTERQRSEIENLQHYLSNIIDSMPSIIIGVDGGGRVTQWNLGAVKETGIEVDEALQKDIVTVYPRISSKKDFITESIRTGTIHTITHDEYETANGLRYENITIFPLITVSAEGAVIRIDDVTRQRSMELQLNQNRKMDAIGELAGGVAHDFNNMLTGITGAAELLRRHVSADGARYLEILSSAAARAADLTSKLLTFSRKTNVELTPIDLRDTVEGAVSLLERTIDKKVEISCKIDADQTIIDGNDSQLQNALLNIGINAAHAMNNSGELSFVVRNIVLEEDYCTYSPFDIHPGNFIEVEVRDTGCGITADHIKRIFEPFYTTKEKGKGTGLGLSAVYGIILEHSGAIHVYSEPGVGTAFKLLLPVSQSLVVAQTEERQIVYGTGTILLVDDEELIRVIGKDLLESLNYRVILACDGLEAISIFKEQSEQIDLVILDMIMPTMSGSETFHGLRKIKSDIKIILSSGFSNNKAIEELKKSGLQGFINKPYNKVELSNILARSLQS